MNKTNSIVICKETYEDRYKNPATVQEDFANAIKDAIMVLLNNGYIATIRYDEPGLGIVSIDYNHNNQEYGDDYPYWLSPTEYESVIFDDERENEEKE